ncbi:small nuclear ribonucleoprotein Sm D3 [Salpingoeca rosetta]|uniref:Small nuclear ribonucleoprotein Sm D3 n=1 Tax=Salpingoeca rosetta (strain ATCC 50818 / BSB-021) TaxID=946362 RepID=F2UD37_SALR5|nr:small nuclear ribonucleoprotein Sm D3 [Salpingoeca rosetta]EGD74532.1 small nuclear ribonucleoprotein Sm D3 [Salpingoeca rosetta]|eukprot:XP_004992789.1 small nuclear ribonucleoprotein Sm D3 [Salpingoeca rosetta]
MSGVSVPVKLMHEAEGHTITIELKNGEMYRGKLIEAEDNMNSQMRDVTFTARDGQVTQLDTVYIRGSKIKFFVLPDMLKNAPFFKRAKGAAVGVGKAGILKAKAAAKAAGRGGAPSGGRGRGRGLGRR